MLVFIMLALAFASSVQAFVPALINVFILA
jgi:hypothetical protein